MHINKRKVFKKKNMLFIENCFRNIENKKPNYNIEIIEYI